MLVSRNLHYAAAPSSRCQSLPKVRHAARQCDTRRSPLTCHNFLACANDIHWHVTGFSDTCHWKPEVSWSIVACANGVCASDVMSRNVKTATPDLSYQLSNTDYNVVKLPSVIHLWNITHSPAFQNVCYCIIYFWGLHKCVLLFP